MELIASALVPCDYVPSADLTSEADDQDSDFDDGTILLTRHVATADGYLTVALSDGSLHLFSANDASHILKIQHSSAPSNCEPHTVWGHRVSRHRIVTGGLDGSLKVWSIPDGQLLCERSRSNLTGLLFENDTDDPDRQWGRGIRHVEIVPSQRQSKTDAILASERHGSIHYWEVGSPRYARSFSGVHTASVITMLFHKDAKHFLSSSRDGTSAAWNLDTGDMLWKNAQDAEVHAVAMIDDKIVLGRRDGRISVLAFNNGDQISSFDTHEGEPIVRLLHMDDTLISVGYDGYAKIWSLASLQTSHIPSKDIELYTGTILDACVVNGWLLAFGGDGPPEEDADACMSSAELRCLNLKAEDDKVISLGWSAVGYTALQTLDATRNSAALVLMRKCLPCLEIWAVPVQS